MVRTANNVNICWLSVALGFAVASGCYDTQRLVEKVRSNAIQSQLEEVSIGYFRTTLPQSAIEATRMEIEIDLFGTAVRYKIPEIEAAIKSDEHRLRQAVVVALRQTTAEEMDDPNLTALRKRLLETVNEQLVDTPVESLGIRLVRFIPL